MSLQDRAVAYLAANATILGICISGFLFVTFPDFFSLLLPPKAFSFCYYKFLTGHPCMFCYLSRAFRALLLKGDIAGALSIHSLSLFYLIVGVFETVFRILVMLRSLVKPVEVTFIKKDIVFHGVAAAVFLVYARFVS